jgi:glutamate-1-semialdehyde 2,1-aminomutase
MLALHFTDKPVVDYRGVVASDKKKARDLFFSLLNHGVLMAPRLMGALSTPMGEDDVQRFVDAVDASVAELKPRWEAAEPAARAGR